MSDEKYRQISSKKDNCTQGHWTGIPSGGSGSGCWLCQYGCAVLAYLKWKGKEPNESNVTSLLNQNADVIWSKMGISEKSDFSAPSIGKLSSRNHYVYNIKENKNGNCNIFDPGKRSNTSMKKSGFECYYY